MWLTACPVESEQPGAEINYIREEFVYENSLYKIEKAGTWPAFFHHTIHY
jgi:hypothetical protein